MVLTESQKEIQKRRKISKAVTTEQAEKGKEKKQGILREELAQARAERKGLIAVPTKEGFDARTPEEVRVLQERKQEEAAAKIQAEQPINPTLALLAEEVGRPMPFGPSDGIAEQQKASPLDYGQALAAAGKAAVPGAITGGVAGAIGGAAATGPLAPLGAVVGGVVIGVAGAVGTGFVAFMANLKKQRKEEITASAGTLPKREKNLRAYATDTNQGGDVQDNLERFNLELFAIEKDYAQIFLDSKNKVLGEDATVELATYEMFYEPGGTRERLIYEMQQAILNPDPSKNLMTLNDFE